MNEYADISIDENGDEYVSRVRQLDVAKHARLHPKKRASYRPVDRKDAKVDPLTQRRGPEVVTIAKNKVTITTEAIDLDADERRAVILRKRDAEYQRRGFTADAMTRALFAAAADSDDSDVRDLAAIRDAVDQEYPLP